MIAFIDDCISNQIPQVPPSAVTVPSDERHPCSVQGITDFAAKHARSKDLHNVVKSCQSHKHSTTCYKYWKQGQPKECRFGLGEHRHHEKTEFDPTTGELQILIRCLDGLVNNFNTTMIELIRSNMDIQFLGSGPSTKAVIYYITDYITKTQLKTHVAYAALALAVQKLQQNQVTDDIPTTRAKRLLQKCAFSMVAHQELSGQQVASYLVDLEDHFTSHTFQPLYWTNYERIVNNDFPLTVHPESEETTQPTEDDVEHDAEEDIEHDESISVTDNQQESDCDEVIIMTNNEGHLDIRTPYTQDYLLRGAELRSLSVWEYMSMVQKIPKKRILAQQSEDHHQSIIVDDNSHTRPKFEFDRNHPDYNTHIQQLRHPNNRPVPTPVGPSLPRRDKIDCHEQYCRLMLVLLKPWNKPEDLINGNETFENAFETFLQENVKWKPLLDNMQLLHECRDNRDDHFQMRSRTRTSAAQHASDGIGRTTNDSDDFELTNAEMINDALLTHLTSIDDSRSQHINESQQTADQCVQGARLCGLFFNNPTHMSSTGFPDQLGTPVNENTLLHEQDWEREYNQRKQIWKSSVIHDQECVTDLHTVNHADVEHRTILNADVTQDALPTIQHTRINKKSKSECVNNMQNILSEFTLNKMQSAVYKRIAEHSFSDNAEQLRMFVAGPAGTGKSWVIDALRKFFQIQNQHYRLRLASFTGVASRNIHGMTLHSALCLNKLNKRSDKAKMDLIAMWRNVDYLIVDEVSMIGCRLMLKIHEALCEAKENSELFGGINIIFVGDFAQLPPVGDTKLYSHLKKETIGTTNGQKSVFGKLLWLSVDKVIILNELVRQSALDDPLFTDLLARSRTGSCTDADYNFLSNKQLRNTTTNFTDPSWATAPIIVSNNDAKDCLNVECARSFAARTKQPLHYYYATDKHKGKTVKDSDLRNKLWSYHSGKTEQRLGMMPLCKGMPVMITQNYDVENGIVNGCIGILEKINYIVDDEGNRHATSCIILAPKTSGPSLPHLKQHEVVVLTDETALTFTHPHSHVRSSFRRTQLPIMPAFALTAHKSQGNTLESAILDLESCLNTEAAYVMLSRVKKSAYFAHSTELRLTPESQKISAMSFIV